MGAKNHCNQYFYHAFRRDQIRKLQERLEFIEDSNIFQDPDSPNSFGSAHVWHQALITSSSQKPSRESRMQRNTQEDMTIPGSVFDGQPARRVPEESYNEEVDLMMASALERCYDKQTHFRKKISVEEQRAQKDNRLLRGRQVAYLIYEYFRPTGSYDEIQGLTGLFSIKLDNDDIHDFDSRWEQALLLTSDPSSDKVLEGLYVSKLQDSSQAHIIKKFCEEEKNEIITD